MHASRVAATPTSDPEREEVRVRTHGCCGLCRADEKDPTRDTRSAVSGGGATSGSRPEPSGRFSVRGSGDDGRTHPLYTVAGEGGIVATELPD